jgi:predicted RNase H-like HicB family nuclease/predicted RNA binding protein YcfA (HicA-like mRNA interferase family)
VRGAKPVSIHVRVRITVEQDGDSFHAFAPALPGCHVSGTSIEGAQRDLNDAIRLYITALIERGLPIPIGCEPEVVDAGDGLYSPTLGGIDVGYYVSASEILDICVPAGA